MANLRLFYAVYAVAVSKIGVNSFTAIKGLQSVGVTTRYNLEQVFEIGQISIYENIENVPDVEITMEKVLDGTPLIYHLLTFGATSASLSGRGNIKSQVAISYFTDTQNSASGTPLSQCLVSGIFPSALTYTIPTEGNTTESVTAVGNNKAWLTSGFTFTGGFTNTDTVIGTSGVQRRQNVQFDATATSSRLPADIPGISTSGTNNKTNGTDFDAHIQSIRISSNLGRDAMYELGRRNPYNRYINFPVEVRCDFEVYCQKGDFASADENAVSNLTDREIMIQMDEGTKLDLGTRNHANTVTETGGNAGARGGNRSYTWSYVNFNDLTITHPHDPSSL